MTGYQLLVGFEEFEHLTILVVTINTMETLWLTPAKIICGDINKNSRWGAYARSTLELLLVGFATIAPWNGKIGHNTKAGG